MTPLGDNPRIAAETSRTRPAAGYFDDRSMLRRVHRERAVALAGPRALLMQAAHPRAVKGLLAHTSALEDPYERLARTAQVMSTIGFGSREAADRVTRRVRALHRRYRVDEPDLLLWVLFTLVDSGLVLYQRYVGTLSRDEQAGYWEDYKVVGRLFGLRKREMPATLDDLDYYRRRMLEGDELFVTDWARKRARRIVLEPPVPWVARPLLETVNFITIALLPDRIRDDYGFSSLPPVFVRKALVAGGAEYVKRAVIPMLPEKYRYVPSARAA
jgi:uncharacterized protein (DUF2236 family)